MYYVPRSSGFISLTSFVFCAARLLGFASCRFRICPPVIYKGSEVKPRFGKCGEIIEDVGGKFVCFFQVVYWHH